MSAITIAPTVIEYGLHGELYDGLLVSLREAGYDVRFDDPSQREEYRSVPGDVARFVADVLVFVDDHAGDAEALAYLALLLRQALRRTRKSKRRRTAMIYGPRGEVLKRVELDDEESPI